MYTFLAGLPAILAVLGFISYQLLRGKTPGEKNVSDVVAKLRQQIGDQPEYQGLRPEQLERRIQSDQQLRGQINEQDYRLLRRVLRDQHQQTLVVYVVLVVLFLVGTGAFLAIRPHPLVITDFHLTSLNSTAHDVPVDLDSLLATWTSTGDAEDVTVSFENVRSGARTGPLRVGSADGHLVIPPEAYHALLTERARNGANPFRIVIQTAGRAYESNTFDVLVGMTVAVVRTARDSVQVGALIDNTLIPNYTFQGRLLLHKHSPGLHLLTFGDTMHYGRSTFHVAAPESIDWGLSKFAYFGPDDDRRVRVALYIDPILPAGDSRRPAQGRHP